MEFKNDAALIPKFLSFYQKDIRAYFPDFVMGTGENEIRFVVLRDIVVANLFVATVNDEGDAFVKINYTVPKYRDYKVGTYIFEKEKDFLIANGVKRIVYTSVQNKNHKDFLKVMGFEKENINGTECFVKSLV